MAELHHPDTANPSPLNASAAPQVLAVESLTTRVAEMHHAKEEISALKYSPDGSRLAAGSHDNFIYIYNTLQG